MADEAMLPTADEIAALPRWARVAFAARCARRMLPNHLAEYAVRHKDMEAISEGVAWLEAAAAIGVVDRVRARSLADVADGAYAPAYHAAHAALALADGEEHEVPELVHTVAEQTAEEADPESQSEPWLGPEAGRLVSAAVLADFRVLHELSSGQHWTDDTPVPPWMFGPMWPDGVPDGWPEADPYDRLVITVEAPPGATAEQIADLRTRLYESANQLVLAHGGPGLTLDLAKRLVTVNVLVPEGA